MVPVLGDIEEDVCWLVARRWKRGVAFSSERSGPSAIFWGFIILVSKGKPSTTRQDSSSRVGNDSEELKGAAISGENSGMLLSGKMSSSMPPYMRVRVCMSLSPLSCQLREFSFCLFGWFDCTYRTLYRFGQGSAQQHARMASEQAAWFVKKGMDSREIGSKEKVEGVFLVQKIV